jgi:aldose sugar dehydrogenase
VAKFLAPLFAAFSLLAAITCAPSGSETAAETGAMAAEEGRQSVTPASRLFTQNCASCHGDRGQGGGAGTSTLLTEDLFGQEHDRRFFDAIKNGVPEQAMPAYGDTMSDSEIWSLVVHVRELQARALRRELGPPEPANGVYGSRHERYRIEDAIPAGPELRIPWGVAWLPDGRMLITNRPGTMFVADRAKRLTEVEEMPPVVHNGQGGLMDVAVHPEYAKNGWIYLALNDPAPGGGRGGMTKIVRGRLDQTGGRIRWSDEQTIYQAAPEHYTTSGLHFGSRIVFDGKGHVFFAIGDRGPMQHAQDLARPNGKMFRVHEDGRVPKDNPFVGREGALPEIWSYGHRNPQGIVFGQDGALWITEHGPRGGDELNLIERGANYGWPVVSFGINYNDAPFRTPWPPEGREFARPVYRWIPSTGVCGLAVGAGDLFPGWKGDLFAGGLSGQNVDRIRVRDGQMTERETILQGLGRVRDVKLGPEGAIYVVLNDPDKVIRLVPDSRD